jgi:uracil-DNA glycosylase
MPVGAHMLRAFEGIPPHHVRCVILGQAPYRAPDFATDRAFETGNVASWRELDKMFSKSVRAFIQ